MSVAAAYVPLRNRVVALPVAFAPVVETRDWRWCARFVARQLSKDKERPEPYIQDDGTEVRTMPTDEHWRCIVRNPDTHLYRLGGWGLCCFVRAPDDAPGTWSAHVVIERRWRGLVAIMRCKDAVKRLFSDEPRCERIIARFNPKARRIAWFLAALGWKPVKPGMRVIERMDVCL